MDEASGTWTAQLGVVPDGPHTLYARARMGTTTSATAASAFSVAPAARVERQVVAKNAPVDPAAGRSADGLASWRYTFATSEYGNGHWTLVNRLVEGGLETARETVRARFH